MAAAGLVALAVAATAGCSYDADVAGRVALDAAAQSSKIFAADGSLLATLHAEENRETVPLERMAPALRDAVVAIEDERFWRHHGVDLRSVLRAVYRDASSGEVVEGGSTITQQYVKNSLLDPSRTLNRKLREASLAYQLERDYSKERILEGYLNTIYFGNGAYGAEAAAGVYFATSADRVSLPQAALLAALVRAPGTYDPYEQPEAARRRRDLVLDKLEQLGWADAAEAAAARAAALGVVERPSHQRYPAPHFIEMVKRFVLDDPRFGATADDREAALFTGGLRVHTTLDPRRQAAAEAAVAAVLPDAARDPAAAVVSIEPASGHVVALVGGRDFFGADPQAKFNLAAQGRRQAGSAFKPLVLAAALADGIPLARTYAAPGRITVALPRPARPWVVDNYEGAAGGTMDLVEATVRSVNTVYAQLVMDVGPDEAVALAERMGVATTLQAYPSAVLGTNVVTPLDMAGAYATLANRGVRVEPAIVTRVTKADGTTLYEHRRLTSRALPRPVADTVNGVLQQAVERGTGARARLDRPVAGKTGTSQRWRDAWFAGYTPQLATAVWVGFPDAARSMVPPTTRIRVTGGSWPAEIWQRYSTVAVQGTPAQPFPDPGPLAPPAPRAGAGAAAGVTVPVVTGMPAPDAVRTLTDVGLVAVQVDVPGTGPDAGLVLGQSPGEGTLAPGGRVTLEVSTGEPAG